MRDKTCTWAGTFLADCHIYQICQLNLIWFTNRFNKVVFVYVTLLNIICWTPTNKQQTQYQITNKQTKERKKEGNVLFNDALNTFLIRLYGVGHMVKDHSDSHHMGYSFRLAAMVLLYAPSHRQDITHHGLCYILTTGFLTSFKTLDNNPGRIKDR